MVLRKKPLKPKVMRKIVVSSIAVAILGIGLFYLIQDTTAQGNLLGILLRPILATVNSIANSLLNTVHGLTAALTTDGLTDRLAYLIQSRTDRISRTTDQLTYRTENILELSNGPLGTLFGTAGGIVANLLETLTGLLLNLVGALLILLSSLAEQTETETVEELLTSITDTIDDLLKNVGTLTDALLKQVTNTLNNDNTSSVQQLTSTGMPLLNVLDDTVNRLDGTTRQLLNMVNTDDLTDLVNGLLKNVAGTLNSITTTVSGLLNSLGDDLLGGDIGTKLNDISDDTQTTLTKITDQMPDLILE